MADHQKQFKPPFVAASLLKHLFPDDGHYSTIGDLQEVYACIARSEGKFRAWLWYWTQLLLAFPPFIRNTIYWRTVMIKNYLKIAFRSFYKNKMSSVINLSGLSIAIGCAIVMFLIIDLQLNMDRFHEHAEDIYLVETVIQSGDRAQTWGNSPVPLGPALERDFPRVERAVRIARGSGAMRYGDMIFNESICFVDESFFEMFSFPLKYGDKNALSDPAALIITEDIAVKYFAEKNALGKQVTITFNNRQVETFFVRGVVENRSYKASFGFDILIAYDRQKDIGKNLDNWAVITAATFIQVSDPGQIRLIETQLEPYIRLQNAASPDRPLTKIAFDPLLDVPTKHLNIRGSILAMVHPAAAFICGTLALFVLALACFSFMNISIASASRRVKEIGIRKVIGGNKTQLALQFLSENVMLCLMALFFGIALAEFYLIPGMNNLIGSGESFYLDYSQSVHLWIFFVLLLILTGFGAGGYPAFYIAAFQPTRILRGAQTVKGKKRFTRVLLTFQFMISFILIALGFTMIQNSDYQRAKDWGYNQAQTIVIPFRNNQDYTIFKNEIGRYHQISAMAGSVHHVGRSNRQAVVKINGTQHEVKRFDIGYNYIETLKLRLKEGRSFDPALSSDIDESVVVNEAFIRQAGWKSDLAGESALGKTILLNNKRCNVIGIVEDFHYTVFIYEIEPVILCLSPEDQFQFLAINTPPGKAVQTADYLKASWGKLIPNIPYEGFFQDEVFDDYFRSSDNNAKIFTFISFVALLLSSMGLFGLVTLMLTKRMKEISIRKVFGASVADVIKLINKEFALILVVSAVFGSILGYVMINALMNMMSGVGMPLGFSPFIYTLAVIFITVFLTIISQVYKGAITNPVDMLRHE